MAKIIIAYVPGLHEGYLRFFKKHSDADVLYILGRNLTDDFRPLVKDIRALDPELSKKAVESWNIFKKIEILNQINVLPLVSRESLIVMPDESESREFAGKNLSCFNVVFDPVFLRWDKSQSITQNEPKADRVISEEEFDLWAMALASSEAGKSSDWWRQVGAVLKCRESMFVAHNQPSLNDHIHHLFGDPRSNFKKGIHFELSLFDHAEATLIAMAAKFGVAVEGASLYVTTFPCPPCAKLAAKSGVKRLYYREGYAVIDGEDVLKQKGVEIILVK